MRLLEPTAQIWMKIDPYYQRQKCRPMNLVSANIRFMRIFAGVPLDAGIKPHWGCRQRRFRWLYVLENFTDTASNNMWRYATPCRPANDCKVNDLEWPWAAISWQNAFSASTSGIRAFECQIVQPLRFCGVLCIARPVSQPRYRHAQLRRCFSAVAELLVIFSIDLFLLYPFSIFFHLHCASCAFVICH